MNPPINEPTTANPTTANPTTTARTFSPKRLARFAGFFFLLTIVGGVIAEGFISNRLIKPSDAAATAANILAHRQMFEFGLTVYLLEMVSQIVQVALFYRLLKPAGATLAVTSAFIELAGCIIKTFARVFYVAPLLLLSGAPYLSVFTGEQLQALSLLFLKVNNQGAGIALAFFGFSGVVQGYLMLRATFLPKFLGWLSIVGGIGWIAYVYPPLGARAFMIVAPLALLGAVATIGWLLVKGVDEEKWRAQAAA